MTVSRREFIRSAAAVGVGLGGSVLLGASASHAADKIKIKLQTDWVASSRYLGEVVAQEMGFYAEEGVSVTIELGGPTNTGVPSVAAGSTDLGLISTSPTILAARSGNIPLKCIAVGYQRHPYSLYSLPKKPIRSAKDLVGKKIGIAKSGFIVIQAVMKKNNLPLDSVELIALANDVAPLFSGQVDAVASWATDATKLSKIGAEAIPLAFWDTGVQLYANPYYATDTMIEQRPDMLAAFIAGTARGWAYAKEMPESAIDMLIKAYPVLDRGSELKSVQTALGYALNADTKTEGWGAMRKAMWQNQVDLFEQIGQFKDGIVPTVDDVMTMKILDMTKDKRPKI